MIFSPQPMYLDTIEADDRSQGSSWSRRADELFVKDEKLVEESDHTMNISSSSDYVSVWEAWELLNILTRFIILSLSFFLFTGQ